MRRHAKGQKIDIPKVQGLVVITAKADLTSIAQTEIGSVITIDDFVRLAATPGPRVRTFGAVAPGIVANPLTSDAWKHQLGKFFNVQTGPFKPGQRRYGGFVAISNAAEFEHPDRIYREYEAIDENAAHAAGTLRIWDFTKADTRFQTAEGRAEIVGRERQVVDYLRDRSEECELAMLPVKAEDSDRGVFHWEVYDRRKRIKRLANFSRTEGASLSRDARIELARQVVAKVSAFHLVDAAHLDLGSHSIWLQTPSTVKISHFLAASYSELRSLGPNRYQFLSAAHVPEDVLGGTGASGRVEFKRKDVFLLGVVVHQIIFGLPPKATTQDMPVEWSPSIDTDGTFAELHSWFETALALLPSDRFTDARAALESFNIATASRPTVKEVIEGLERFRTSIRSQMQLFAAWPPTDVMRDDERTAMWRSQRNGQSRLVKMWKRASWGDQTREGPRILDFLTRGRDLSMSPPPGCAAIREVMWLGDAIVTLQDWIDAPNLTKEVNAAPDLWGQNARVLEFLKVLAERVTAIHDLRIAHGDLKPENILVLDGSAPEPVLVDLLEFTAGADGDVQTSAYAPSTGGRQERDRFAVTKIAEERLRDCTMDPSMARGIQRSIDECRSSVPPNGTLQPLLEELARALRPPETATRPAIRISIFQAQTGSVLPDEGLFFIRLYSDRSRLFLRGTCEEIEIVLDNSGKPVAGRRREIDQKLIPAKARYEFMSLPADVEIVRADMNDFAGLDVLFSHPDYIQGSEQASRTTGASAEDEQPALADAFEDRAEDQLSDEIAADPPVASVVDVKHLWRRLIDAESDLTTEGVATGESSFRRESQRHVVPFELETGSFDFDREDRVLVERRDAKGRWRSIGHLDIKRSNPKLIAIDASAFFYTQQTKLVEDEQRLRFRSHFEITSLQRRETAISRVLAGQSRIPDLIQIFDPASGKTPQIGSTKVDPAVYEKKYGLNRKQAVALSELRELRPVGLVQGPPGTGKTVFIAALVHDALTSSLARNILVASQSHEAVNNAAEAILKLFAKETQQPSILRVGQEAVVSDRLLPFHTARVEQLCKDRFQASLRDRLRIGGRALGIGDKLIDDIVFIETAIRPVIRKLTELDAGTDPDKQRIDGLRETLRGQLEALQLADMTIADAASDEILDLATLAVSSRVGPEEAVSPDKIARIRALAALARDFVGSVSTARRSFETFLAGTRQVVVGTCVGLGRLSLGLTTTPFDLVVVDEAARCTASELSVPIQAGRWVVLVGDHAQLEPQHKAQLVQPIARELKTTSREVIRSDFDRVFRSSYGKQAGHRLETQYRMLPPIGRIVSSSFYNNGLEPGRTDPEIPPEVLPGTLDKAVTWVATDELGERAFQKHEDTGTSLRNPMEADIITSLLRAWDEHNPFRTWLATQTKHARPIGIICTYAAQRDLLRRKTQLANLSETLQGALKIDTVDSYQGKENPIVVLSLVRNNADGPQENGVATIDPGFMSRDNRINVAISRAMDRLVIVGSKGRWPSCGPMSRVVQAFAGEVELKEARVIPAPEIYEERRSPLPRARQSEKPAPGATPAPTEA